ncbi:hypothetical protein V5F32_17425 [Xanthobacter oligotrophicus]|uniref:DUF5666 domain-containing protein n=1 Tax=Xanthobacter oligotrophicus TaxID=2607286 RepID=A0ABW6ZYY8_9HYPH
MRPMPPFAATLAAACAFLALAIPAVAQTVNLRGTISSIAGGTAVVHARDGQDVRVALSDRTTVVGLEALKLADIPTHSYVGVAALPQEGAQPGAPERAVSIHVFPEAARGTGDGTRAYDLAPNATMTNGALAETVVETSGNLLTIAYGGGRKQVLVTPATSLVRFVPGSLDEVKAGARVVIRGVSAGDGALEAQRVLVGRGDVVPAL